MYQALYRKWRPKTFEDVVGQEHVTTTLKNEIKHGRPSHAYLLMGSRGTGKTTCAKLIAKAVNCLDPQDGSPCGKCNVCVGIDNGSMVDVVEIDAASNNGVDNIRDLREEANFLPNVTKYRVYIIDEAHMLSMGAVNALLKIMEEPPSHVIFILATTEIHKMPATIQSRCQRFDFGRIDTAVITGRLKYIADEEGISYQEEALALVAKLADGGMRDALSILDLCISHGGSISVETVSRAAGLVGQEYLFDIASAISRGNLSAALELIDKVGSEAVEYDRLCQQLATHYRNLLVAATAKEPQELIICLPETLEAYQAQAKNISTANILYAIKTLQETQGAMTRTASRRTEMEIAAAKLCDSRLSASPEALVARIEALEAKLNRLQAGIPAASPGPAHEEGSHKGQAAPAFAPAAEQEPPVSAAPQEETLSSDAVLMSQWEDVVARLGITNKALKGALVGSQAYLSGTRVLISCDNPVFTELMRSNDYTKQSLKDAIAEVTGKKYAIGPYSGPKKLEAAKSDPMEEILKLAKEGGVKVVME